MSEPRSNRRPASRQDRGPTVTTSPTPGLCEKCRVAPKRTAHANCRYCVTCKEAADLEVRRKMRARWDDDRRERDRQSKRGWKKRNPDKVREDWRRQHEAHREDDRLASRRRYWANPEAGRDAARRYAKENPGKNCASSAMGHARKLNVAPKWLDRDLRRQITDIYIQAERQALTVDHIVPMSGCRLCGAHGLHVPWNLQLLTLTDNLSKKDRCQNCWSDQ